MPKRSIIRCCVLALALLTVLLLCSLILPSSTAGDRAKAASDGLNEYTFDLIFRPEEYTLAVTMQLDYTNTTGDILHNLVLRTWPNAYASPETSPAAIDETFDACYPNGFSEGTLTLEGIWWNDQLISDYLYLDDAMTALSVPVGTLSPGAQGALLLRCRITVPNCAHRFGYSDGVWQFGHALPILSVYQDGVWRTDPYAPIGDPFVSECANYAVSLTLPDGYLCAASAKPEKTGNQVYIRSLAARDFSFVLSKDWKCETAKVNGIEILSFASDKKSAARAAACAKRAIQFYEKRYGAYPYETFTLCEADFPLGGMEYSGLIVLDQRYYAANWADTLELLIAHEAAHQWFYALVGSDQYYSPWQDEALCEWAVLRYTKQRYGASAYENLIASRIEAPMQERILSQVTPGSPIDYFSSYADYSSVVYGRGAALMLAIEEMTGSTDDFLRAYCDRFSFSLASREDFALCLNEWSGMDLSPLILDYIDTYIN